GVVSTDAQGRITFLNPVAEQLTGWSEAEAQGRESTEVLRMLNASTREPLENSALTAMRAGRQVSSHGPARLLGRDGTERAIADAAAPIRNDDDAIIGCVMVLRDVTDRELADSALQASQEMFRMITDHISDMITVLDLNGRRLYNSASYARILAEPNELYGTDSFASIHPEDRERIKEIFAQTVQTGVGQRAEYRLIGNDGSEVRMESMGSVIQGPDRRPEKVLVVSRDITERHRFEERLLREKEFSETLINSMPGIFYLYDQRRIMVRWNKNLETVTQYSSSEITRLDPLDFFRPDQKQLVHNRMLQCFAEGSAEVEVVLVAKDGSEHPFYVTGLRVQIDGHPCMLGVGIDISERRRAEEAVRGTMRRLGRQNRALSEQARAPALGEMNVETAFRRITEVAAETLELRRSSIWLYNESRDVIRCEDLYEADGKKHSRGLELAARDYPSYFAALAKDRAIAANDARSDPKTCEFTENYLKPLKITSMLDAPIRSGGRMVGVVCAEHTGPMRSWTPDEQNFAGSMADHVSLSLEVIQRQQAEAALREARDNLEIKVADRTRDLEEANERLKELDRLKSEFVATMSHELRTPLNSIIGFTGILRQGLAGPLNPEQLKQLGMVHFSARHLLGLINDLLDLSRIESGKMEVVAESFSLEEVVEEVVQSLTPAALQKKLTLETQLDPPHISVHSDRKKVFQILLNLANNAVKFTEKGTVHIGARVDANEVVLEVADTGIGIRPESIAGLFQAFRQVDGSARRVYEGTGLGLYLCKKLSNMLGGRIRAESEFGTGSRFTVNLPRKLPETTSPQ
ncbi:MAG: PAS domain S-box protein, partial [Chthoniobacteraceae bacterium]